MDKQKEKKKKVLMPFGLRNKLIAAISMLLVSSIMMVSSTYAWFTLSTAPEVKNISTTVAGNGSLEIALMPTGGQLSEIKASAVGANAKAIDTNIKWGNLVDLSDVSYGLGNISLYPAALNATETKNAESKVYTTALNGADEASGRLSALTAPLAVPVYGGDGRISSVSTAGISLKSAVAGANNSYSFTGDNYGVRAIVETAETNNGTTVSAYGYVVDLALRLNTAKADGTTAGKLLLQTGATQRIYGDSTNEETMGGGSYMEFTAPEGSGLTDAMIKELMKSIRVTFVENYGVEGAHLGGEADGKQIKVLGTAMLDDATSVDGKYKANLSLYQSKDVTTTTAEREVTNKVTTKLEGANAVLIEEMTKNSAKQISAIVWLDGATVKNADVAATMVQSLTGKLNLQFSTDVTLNPAANNELKGTVNP